MQNERGSWKNIGIKKYSDRDRIFFSLLVDKSGKRNKRGIIENSQRVSRNIG